MKLTVAAFFVLITLYASAQKYEECTRKDLPPTKTIVSLKGSVTRDTIFISPDTLKKGIELELAHSIGRIIGYYVLRSCEDCNIVAVPVCGSKMEDRFFQQIKNVRRDDWLEFFWINIEINGKRYSAPDFVVYIKE